MPLNILILGNESFYARVVGALRKMNDFIFNVSFFGINDRERISAVVKPDVVFFHVASGADPVAVANLVHGRVPTAKIVVVCDVHFNAGFINTMITAGIFDILDRPSVGDIQDKVRTIYDLNNAATSPV